MRMIHFRAHLAAAAPRARLTRKLLAVAAAASSAAYVALVPSTAALANVAAQESAALPLTSAQATALSQNVTKHLIVLMKNQPAVAPAGTSAAAMRSSAIGTSQAPFMHELSLVHAAHVRSYRLVNAFAATVSAGEEARLAANPAVATVLPDGLIRGPAATPARAASAAAASLNNIPGACPQPNGKPLLEPEALSLMHVASDNPAAKTAQSLGYTGKGVKVAYIADGVDTNNPDLKSAFVDYQDFSGDGPNAPTSGDEAFLDATSIAAQGSQVYNVQNFGPQALPKPCNIRIVGVAPGVGLVGLKVFAENSLTTTSNFLQAISYAVLTDHVNVLNESFGSNPFPDTTSQDAVKQFNDAAVTAGTTVSVSSGDAGTTSTIGSPSTDPKVLSVGGSTDFRWYAQTDYGAARQFATKGWLNDNITSLSSGGFTQNARTVDLVAPGDSSFAVCTANLAVYAGCTDFNNKASNVERSGGTSQSSPLTAGTAALVIQAYRLGHGGATPSPALVKRILTSSADDLSSPAYEQGAGLVNAYRAVLLARSIRPAHGSAASPLLISQGQLSATASAGALRNLSFSVTNESSSKRTVRLHGRGFGPTRNTQTGSVTLSNTASKHFSDWFGEPNNYGTLHFRVPRGADRLDASIAYPGDPNATLNARVRLILIDPKGRYAAHSLPQGIGNFGHVDVRFPAAGRWTAIIFSIESSAGGTVGKVRFEATTSQFTGFGSVSPSVLHLAPGQTGQVRLRVRTPSSPGDESGAVVLNEGGAGNSSVAVVLRSLVNASRGGAFSGVLTGGNGRQGNTGQTNYYQSNVPSGRHSLAADISLTTNKTDTVVAYFINPQNQTVGYGTNYLTTSPTTAVPTLRTSLYTLNPRPGRWTLIIDFAGAIAGNVLSQPFHGRVRFNTVNVHAKNLPHSAKTVLKAGVHVTVPVTIKNTGTAPESFFVDGRLTSTATLSLAPLTSGAATLPPTTSVPQWLVPTQTDAVHVTASATLPAQFDYGIVEGDPDLESSTPPSLNPAGSFSANPVTAGLWFAIPSEFGPYPGAAPAGSINMAMTAHARQFDGALTSAPGDFWQASVNPSAPFGLFIINPGQTRTIKVTITPSGAKGTVVRGTLFVDDFVNSPFFLSGDELAGLPYTYKIG